MLPSDRQAILLKSIFHFGMKGEVPIKLCHTIELNVLHMMRYIVTAKSD
jgi:hypothetical protein